jgi:leader peptidase (prepilin peptidase)/N-methyltransferase
LKLWFFIWLPKLTYLLFVVAFGGCVGSLINVLAYRMPLGLSVVTPPSRCPKCNTRLSWRDNIPVLGWIFLRGRCRYCSQPISPEYPIVEACVAALFGVVFTLYFIVPDGAVWLGIPWGSIKPEWALNPPDLTWPTMMVVLILLGALAAMTIVDAKTSTIPLAMTWVPAAVALVVHPLHALWMQNTYALKMPHAPAPWVWTIPTPGMNDWWWIGASIGGTLGLGVGLLLLATGVIGRSFADYAEWERSVLPPAGGEEASATGGEIPPPGDAAGPVRTGQIGDPGIAGPDGPPAADSLASSPSEALQTRPNAPEDLWIQYPHGRREMVKELAFLAPCIALGWAGGWLFERFMSGGPAPLWLVVLSGVLLGYLIGGGLVWAVRIVGTLSLGKEAMGLGDVHMMAAVGACLGWIDSTVAFFLAAFVGLFWTVLSMMFSGTLRRAMPYGPYLAVATVLVMLGKPLIELGLGRLTGSSVNIP